MKTISLIFIVVVLTAQSNSSNIAPCTQKDVTLNDGIMLDNGVLNLSKKFQHVILTTIKEITCSIKVNGYKEMQVEMAVLSYGLKEDLNCQTDYFKAGNKAPPSELVVCQTLTSYTAIKSTNKMLFLEIKSSRLNGNVVLGFNSIQGDECGPSEIVLSTSNETVQLPKNALQFTQNTECDIIVKGLLNRPYTMYIEKINLADNSCKDNYLVVSTEEIIAVQESDKKCKMGDVAGPISATKGVLHLRIVTMSPKSSAGVTLRFKTDYPECGSPQVTIPKDGTEIILPPKGEQFQTNTLCNIAFLGIDGMNFNLTIPEIKFSTGSCNNDYVSASTDQTKLPNANYQKCGENPVNDPFISANGVMFLQIRTSSATAATNVKLKFQPVSGFGKPLHNSFVTTTLINLILLALSQK